MDRSLLELRLERSGKDGALGREGVFLGVAVNGTERTHTGRTSSTENKYAKWLNDLRAVLTRARLGWGPPRRAGGIRVSRAAAADSDTYPGLGGHGEPPLRR